MSIYSAIAAWNEARCSRVVRNRVEHTLLVSGTDELLEPVDS